MWSQQSIDSVVLQLALARDKADLLQKNVSLRVRDDNLLYPVTPPLAGVDKPVSRHALFQRRDSSVRVALLFGEILVAVGNEKFHVTSISLVYSRIVDFIQDSVRNREPDPTLIAGRCADSFFRAGGPSGLNARPTRSTIFQMETPLT